MAKSNFIDAEKTVKQLNDAFKAHSEIIDRCAESFKKLDKSIPKTPGEFAKKQKEISTNIDAVTVSTKNLTTAKKNLDQKTAEEIVNQRILNQNAIQAATINSTLAGAYAKLSAEQAKSARHVQNLIAQGKSATQTQKQYDAELRIAQKEFDKLNQKVLLADRAVGKFNRNVGNYPKIASGFKDLLGAFGLVGGVTAIAAISKDIFVTTRELQSLDLALKQVTGTTDEFTQSQEFLKKISEDYGVEIKGLTKQYTQFYVAAKDKLAGKEIQGIFESVAKSAGFMGLSVDAQNRAFTALNQMMSKGTVTAEELKGQLGEALPGAFGIMAKAVGVTEKQLGEMMKKGEIMAADVLPRFAKELEKAYGIDNKNRVESLAASTTRLSNAWTDFIASMNSGSGMLSKTLIFLIDSLGKITTGLKVVTQSSREFRLEQNKMLQNTGYEGAIKYLDEIADKEERISSARSVVEVNTIRIQDLKNQTAELDRQFSILARSEKMERGVIGRIMGLPKTASKELKELNDQIKQNTSQIYFNKGGIQAANEVLNDSIKTTQKATEEKSKLKELTFEEIRSIYELRKARLDLLKSGAGDRMDNDDALLTERLNARIEFSEKSMELLDLEIKYERDVTAIKYKEDLKQNNEAFNKKEITYQQFQKNILDITNRFNNEILKIDVDASAKWNDIVNEDLEFYKKVELEKREFSQKTTDLILEGEQKKFKTIADDEKKTLKVRQEAFREQMKLARRELDLQKIRALANSKSDEETANILEKFKQLNDDLNKLESPWDRARKSFRDYLNSIQDAHLEKSLESIGISSAKMFLDFDDNGQSSFMKLFETATTTGEKIAVIFNSVGDVFQEVMSIMNQASEKRFQADMARLDAQREASLKNAGDSASAKEAIEKQYEKKRQDLEKKRLQQQKKAAIFNIIIDTAQAVASAFAEVAFPGNIAVAALMAGLGAAQIAMVSKQTVPAYAEGTDYHPGGDMLVNDGKSGDHRETSVTPDGKITQYEGRNVLTSAPKGTKVFTASQWNDKLKDMLNQQNIGYTQGINISNFEAESNSLTVDQFNTGIDKLSNVIKTKESFEFVRDVRGERVYKKTQGQRIEMLNLRLNIKSFNV